MISRNYIDNIPEPKTNILRDFTEPNLTDLSPTNCSENQINNLILNSNLNDSNMIK